MGVTLGGGLVSSRTMFFAPFLFLYAIIFFFALAFLFAMLELGAIDYAFNALGLPPHAAFWALIISLLGSYINIPITRIESSGGGANLPRPRWSATSGCAIGCRRIWPRDVRR